jgi:hypothetical protein
VLKHIQRRASYLAITQSLHQRSLIYHHAARNIDQISRRLELLQSLGIDEMSRAFRERRRQYYKVRTRDRAIQ